MNSKNAIPDVSYFRLSLTDFLRESHPELLADKAFIVARSEMATETYSQAIQNGSSHIEAAEQANAVLFQDLHFSMHNTLTSIIWNEFSDIIPEEDAGLCFAVFYFLLTENPLSIFFYFSTLFPFLSIINHSFPNFTLAIPLLINWSTC